MMDFVSSAIKDFRELISLLEDKEKSKVGGSFRSRCRELPSLIEDVGLVPALSFFYAKATNSVYNNVKKLIENKNLIKDNDVTKQGYGICFYLVLKMLKVLNLIEADLNDPVGTLEELKGKERVAGKLIRPYIVQLKKLSESVFIAEGERE